MLADSLLPVGDEMLPVGDEMLPTPLQVVFWSSGAMIIVFLTILVLKLLLDKRGVIYDLSIKSECVCVCVRACVIQCNGYMSVSRIPYMVLLTCYQIRYSVMLFEGAKSLAPTMSPHVSLRPVMSACDLYSSACSWHVHLSL